jgi:hypothetical protein
MTFTPPISPTVRKPRSPITMKTSKTQKIDLFALARQKLNSVGFFDAKPVEKTTEPKKTNPIDIPMKKLFRDSDIRKHIMEKEAHRQEVDNINNTLNETRSNTPSQSIDENDGIFEFEM